MKTNYIIKKATVEEIRKAGGYRKYYEMKKKEVREHFSETVKVGRNDKCPCGSEKKYKKCCINK